MNFNKEELGLIKNAIKDKIAKIEDDLVYNDFLKYTNGFNTSGRKELLQKEHELEVLKFENTSLINKINKNF